MRPKNILCLLPLLPLFFQSTAQIHAFSPAPPSPSPSSTVSQQETSKRPFQPSKLDHIVLKCKHFPTMFQFYTSTLGCTIDHTGDIRRSISNGAFLTHLRAGENFIDLLSYDDDDDDESNPTKNNKKEEKNDSVGGLDHFCIRIDPYEEEKIRTYLKDQNVEIISSGLRKGAEGIGPSIYIHDPEGNTVELKGPSSISQQTQIQSAEVKQVNQIVGLDATVSESIISTNDPNDAINQKTTTTTQANEKSTTSSKNESTFTSTPCTRICRYNQKFYDGQVCIGCFRDAYEIGTWSSMSNTEKSFALLDAADRIPDNNEGFSASVKREELLRQSRMWVELSSKEKEQ